VASSAPDFAMMRPSTRHVAVHEERPNACTYNIAMDITLTELEQAINHWRALRPSTGEERALSPEVNALANVYALMIFHHSKSVPLDVLDQASRRLIEAWRKLG
jgi:hypothetical protein